MTDTATSEMSRKKTTPTTPHVIINSGRPLGESVVGEVGELEANA